MHLRVPNYLGNLRSNLHFFSGKEAPERPPEFQRERRAQPFVSLYFSSRLNKPKEQNGFIRAHRLSISWGLLGHIVPLLSFSLNAQKIKHYIDCYPFIFLGKTANWKYKYSRNWAKKKCWNNRPLFYDVSVKWMKWRDMLGAKCLLNSYMNWNGWIGLWHALRKKKTDCFLIAFNAYLGSLEFSVDQMSELEKWSGELCSVPFRHRTMESLMKKSTQRKRTWWIYLMKLEGREENRARVLHDSLIFFNDTYSKWGQLLPMLLFHKFVQLERVWIMYVAMTETILLLFDAWHCFCCKHMLAT